MQFKTTIGAESFDRVGRVAQMLGCSKQYLIDALLRSFDDESLARRVGRQRELDGAARAGWSRSR